MEPLSYDSPVETDVDVRFLTLAKVFVSASVGSRRLSDLVSSTLLSKESGFVN